MSGPFTETLARADAPAPGGTSRTDNADRHQARRESLVERDPMSTITAGHRMAFHWLRSSDGEFGLVSCYVNGKPSALVVAAQPRGNSVEIMPLFVALADGMRVTDPDGDVIFENGGVA